MELKAMRALEFWKTVTMDTANLLDRQAIQYCVIGGQAVNAYDVPLVSLDLDIVISVDQIGQVEALLEKEFDLKRFPYSVYISLPGSDLRVQIQTDPRYAGFIDRSEEREVLGRLLPAASLEDVLTGKIWAVRDPDRRGSKRQKDLADIARIVEAYPDLRNLVPPDVLSLLL